MAVDKNERPWQGFLGMFNGPINVAVNDLMINSDGEIAYSCSVQHVTGTTNEGKPFDSTFRIRRKQLTRALTTWDKN